jgi:protein ImuB
MFAALFTPGRRCPSLEPFSPQWERVNEATSLANVTGMLRLWDNWLSLAQAIHRHSQAGQFDAGHVTIASTPSLAVQICQHYEGIQIVPPGDEESYLLGLPIEVLPVSESTKDSLTEWGILTLQQLLQLPENDLLERLGHEALLARKWALGQTRKLFVPEVESREYQAELRLEEGLANLQQLEFALEQLLVDVCQDLSSNGLSVTELQLELQLESSLLDTRNLRFPAPLREIRTLKKLLMLELEKRKPGSAIRVLKLTAFPAQRRSEQSGLFQRPTMSPEQLEVTLARLKQLVGAKNVGAVELLDTHRPDAWRWTNFTGQTNTVEKPSSPELTAVLRHFRPPIPAQVSLTKGRPSFLEASWIRCRVIRASGPWVLSGDWWRMEDSWSRQQWEVLTKNFIYQIYLDGQNRWFVSGYYD